MNVLEQLQKVTCFVFDVDGVLTDGTVLLLDNGMQARRMHIKDGLALQMAMNNGYKVIVISGGTSEPVIHRLRYLGIEEIHLGVKDKLKLLNDLTMQQGLSWSEVLYMGDDLPDVPVLEKAGLAACPEDAVMEVKKVAHVITKNKGGEGCVREVIEKVLKLNNRWIYQAGITSK